MKDPVIILKLCFLLLLAGPPLWGQKVIEGLVTDLGDQPLPFVNILINDSRTRGVSTDIDGRFRVIVADSVRALTFSYVGYETFRLETASLPVSLRVRLSPAAYGLTEVVVVAGENPADIIMRRAVENRRRNQPENLERYQCQTYNKVVVSLTPSEADFLDFIEDKDTSRAVYRRYRQNMNEMILMSDTQHLFIMESVTQRNYRSPGQVREVVLQNRVSGFREAPLAALANDIQPFSFYDEQLNILDKTFLNPISRGSTRQYFFHLRDSLFHEQDTIFVIEFRPRKGKNFEALQGVLYIHSNGYAVQNVIAEPADTGFIQLRIEQQYILVDGRQWFPQQLNFVLHAQKYPSPFLGTKIYGKSYVDQVRLDPPREDMLFRRAEQVVFAEEAYARSDSLWQIRRKEPLDSLERNTYLFLDQKGEEWKLDKRLDQLEALTTGRWPLGMIDLSLPDVLSFNDFERLRLGAGLYTNDNLARWFSLGGYAGYGWQDRKWKYGGSLRIRLEEQSETQLKGYYQRDLLEPAVPDFELSRPLVSRRFLARRMDQVEEWGLRLSGRPWKYLQLQARLRQQEIRPFGDYRFDGSNGGEGPAASYAFSEAALAFRWAYGENFITFLGNRIAEPARWPVLEAHYIRGLKGWLGGDFAYHKILFSVEQELVARRLGHMRYRLEAGAADRSLPLAKLFNSSGFGRDFQFLTIAHSFQTMDRYEFLSDRFIHFFLEHDFGALLFKTRRFQPELTLVHNLAFGALRHPERHRGLGFKALEKGYYEGGLVVDNLVRFNYFNFLYLGVGLGGYYRYGPYSLEKFADNWAFRLALNFSY